MWPLCAQHLWVQARGPRCQLKPCRASVRRERKEFHLGACMEPRLRVGASRGPVMPGSEGHAEGLEPAPRVTGASP